MVTAVSSINQYIPNPEVLEVVRRLQSLGIAPTGNLGLDKQKLQAAEIIKRQKTLAPNSEQNLTRLEGTGKDFSSTLGVVKANNPLSSNVENKVVKGHFYEMVGASQLAELNKLQLGLIA